MKKFSSLVFLCVFVSALLLASYQEVEAAAPLRRINKVLRNQFKRSEVTFGILVKRDIMK